MADKQTGSENSDRRGGFLEEGPGMASRNGEWARQRGSGEMALWVAPPVWRAEHMEASEPGLAIRRPG